MNWKIADEMAEIIMKNFHIFNFRPSIMKWLVNIVKFSSSHLSVHTKKSLLEKMIFFKNSFQFVKKLRLEEFNDKYFSNKDRVKAIKSLQKLLGVEGDEDKGEELKLLERLTNTLMMIDLQNITFRILEFELLVKLRMSNERNLSEIGISNIHVFRNMSDSARIASLDMFQNKMEDELRILFIDYKLLVTEVIEFEDLKKNIIGKYGISETLILHSIKYKEVELKTSGRMIRNFVFDKSEEQDKWMIFPKNLLVKLHLLLIHIYPKRKEEVKKRYRFPWTDLIEATVISLVRCDDGEGKTFDWEPERLNSHALDYEGFSFTHLWITELLLRFCSQLSPYDLIKIFGELIKSIDNSEKDEMVLKCLWLYLNYLIKLVLERSSRVKDGPSQLYSRLNETVVTKQSMFIEEREKLSKGKEMVDKTLDYCYKIYSRNKNLLPSIGILDKIDALRSKLGQRYESDLTVRSFFDKEISHSRLRGL